MSHKATTQRHNWSVLVTIKSLLICAPLAAEIPTSDTLMEQIRNDDKLEKVTWVPSQLWKTQQDARIYLTALGVRYQIIEGNACQGRKVLITEQIPKVKWRTLPNGEKEKGSWISTKKGMIALKSNTLPAYEPLPDPSKLTSAVINKYFRRSEERRLTTTVRLTQREEHAGLNGCDVFLYGWPPVVRYSLEEDNGLYRKEMGRDVCPGEKIHVSVTTPYKKVIRGERRRRMDCFR